MEKNSQQQILALIKEEPGGVNSQFLVKKLKLSRQTIARHISKLLSQGLLIKSGSTKSAIYNYPKSRSEAPLKTQSISLIKNLKGLEEDLVFKEIDQRINLKSKLSKNTYQIVNYAFTEILNNAIDHSKSNKATIIINIDLKNISFDIKDSGIGAFENIRKTFKLKNIFNATEHLFKGKQSTDPSRHSGQGIFFTSRIADSFIICANGASVKLISHKDDIFFSEIKKIKGTQVTFTISKQSRKSLEELFKRFSNNEFEFDKNIMKIKLSNYAGLLSRSQAKRMLVGLDKFSHIEFDFKKVNEIGQAFADEIFRVFARNNSKTLLTYTNANSAVAYLIERARKS